MDPEGSVRLLGVILAGAPPLPLAACRGHDPRLFDDRHDDGESPQHRSRRHERAREICAGCPERRRCPTC